MPPRKKKIENNLSILDIAVEALKDKKADDILSIEIGKIPGSICDHFIVCSGNSRPHVEALYETVRDTIKQKTGLNVWHSEGYENAEWILLDYFDVVIHIFQPEGRSFYQLEALWADAPTTTY